MFWQKWYTIGTSVDEQLHFDYLTAIRALGVTSHDVQEWLLWSFTYPGGKSPNPKLDARMMEFEIKLRKAEKEAR